jgi:hypothetical protein
MVINAGNDQRLHVQGIGTWARMKHRLGGTWGRCSAPGARALGESGLTSQRQHSTCQLEAVARRLTSAEYETPAPLQPHRQRWRWTHRIREGKGGAWLGGVR